MDIVQIISNFRNRNAKELVDYVQSENSNLYLFIGRTMPWPDEENPPEVEDTLREEYSIWEDINALKRVVLGDISLGFRKIEWAPNTIYDQYDDTDTLIDKEFYVITDENNVYKCISNDNNSISTVKPTHITYDVSFESDGYKWKYMFTIPDSDLRKFGVPDFIPIVFDQQVINNSQPGTIENLKIINPGEGYPINANVETGTEIPVFIQGDGDQNATAIAEIVTGTTQITSISITSPGEDYPYAPDQNIPIAIRQITSDGIIQNSYGLATTNPFGEIIDIDIIIPGEGYVNGPAFIVQSSCKAFVETDFEGKLNRSEVYTGRAGLNFRQAEAIIITEEGTGGEIVPIISPPQGHGSDPAKELFANYVILNLRLADEENFAGIENFRRLGLVESPLKFGQEIVLESGEENSQILEPEVLDSLTADAKYKLVVGSNAGFEPNELLFGETSGAIGRELNLLNNDTLRVAIDKSKSSNLLFEIGETVRGLESNVTATVTNIVEPDVEPYTGEILYINNREVIDRTTDLQIETVTLVLEY